MPERAIPYTPEAEECVIGSILIDGELIDDVTDLLDVDDFMSEKTRGVYQAMISVRGRGEGVNQITVGTELQRINIPGLVSFMSFCIANTPSSLDIRYYADIVKRDSFFRQLINTSSQIASIAFDQNPPDIAASLDKVDGIMQALREKTTTGRSRRLLLGKPRLIETNPPRYIWNVNGKDLRLTLPEITIWGKFKSRVISELNFVPIKPKDWDNTINNLITRSIPIEAPFDASEEQQLKILIQRWFERMREASVHSDLGIGRHIVKEVGNTTYLFFKSTPLLDYLKKDYKRGLNSEDLWVYCHKWSGIKHKVRVKMPSGGSMPTDLWGLPLGFAEELKERAKIPEWF